MSRVSLAVQYLDVAGNPYSGSVLFQPTTVLQDLRANATIGYTGVSVTLDNTGSGSISLDYTDDPEITPLNPAYNQWQYRVQESVCAPGMSYAEIRAPYFIALPQSLGASADLAQVPRTGQPLGYGWFMYGPF